MQQTKVKALHTKAAFGTPDLPTLHLSAGKGRNQRTKDLHQELFLQLWQCSSEKAEFTVTSRTFGPFASGDYISPSISLQARTCLFSDRTWCWLTDCSGCCKAM